MKRELLAVFEQDSSMPVDDLFRPSSRARRGEDVKRVGKWDRLKSQRLGRVGSQVGPSLDVTRNGGIRIEIRQQYGALH